MFKKRFPSREHRLRHLVGARRTHNKTSGDYSPGVDFSLRGSPILTPRGSPILTPRGSPSLTPRSSPNLTPRRVTSLTPRRSPSLTARRVTSLTPTESPRGVCVTPTQFTADVSNMKYEEEAYLNDVMEDEINNRIQELENAGVRPTSKYSHEDSSIRRKELEYWRMKIALEQKQLANNYKSGITLVASTLETLSASLQSDFFCCDGLTKAVTEGIQNGTFSQPIEYYTKTLHSSGSILQSPAYALVTAFAMILVRTHLQAKGTPHTISDGHQEVAGSAKSEAPVKHQTVANSVKDKEAEALVTPQNTVGHKDITIDLPKLSIRRLLSPMLQTYTTHQSLTQENEVITNELDILQRRLHNLSNHE